MATNAKTAAGGGSNIPPMEAGTYPARVVIVADLGLQEQRPWQGEEKPPAREVLFCYEMVDEFLKDEEGEDDLTKPRWVSERMVLHNLNAERAKSTARYNAFDPTGEYDGEFALCINTPVNVTVVQSPGKGKNAGRVYNNVGGVTVMRKKDADACAPLVNPSLVFDLDEVERTTFKSLPEWIRKIIVGNLEYEGSALQGLLVEEPEDTTEAEALAREEHEGNEDETPY